MNSTPPNKALKRRGPVVVEMAWQPPQLNASVGGPGVGERDWTNESTVLTTLPRVSTGFFLPSDSERPSASLSLRGIAASFWKTKAGEAACPPYRFEWRHKFKRRPLFAPSSRLWAFHRGATTGRQRRCS